MFKDESSRGWTLMFIISWSVKCCWVNLREAFTGLHQKRVYSSLGPFCPQYVYQILLVCSFIFWILTMSWSCKMSRQQKVSIKEVPKLVYALFRCKPVKWPCYDVWNVVLIQETHWNDHIYMIILTTNCQGDFICPGANIYTFYRYSIYSFRFYLIIIN